MIISEELNNKIIVDIKRTMLIYNLSFEDAIQYLLDLFERDKAMNLAAKNKILTEPEDEYIKTLESLQRNNIIDEILKSLL